MCEDREKYWGDVVYETWRRGGNPDVVDRDVTSEHQDDGLYPDESARRILQSARRQHEAQEG